MSLPARRPTILRPLLLGCLGLLLIAQNAASTFAQYPRQTATTIDAALEGVEWLGLDAAGRHEFRAAKEADGAQPPAIAVAPENLVAWGAPLDLGRGVHVLLVDGGVLTVETVATDAESLQCTSARLGPRTFPLPLVRGVVFQSTGSRARRERLFHAVASTHMGDRDKLVTLSDDELTGTVKSIDFKGVTMETSLGPVVLELAKTAYVVFNPALAAKAPNQGLRTLVGLSDGSLLYCSQLKEDSDRVRLQLVAPSEGAAEAPWEVGRSEVVFLQTLGGNATYLSDLQPAGYRHVPFLERAWEYGRDRSVGDAGLMVGGKRYLKGIGMHSTSRLTFPIADGRKRFAALAAIDDETDGRGSVTFRVFVDAEERYRSPVVRGGEKPTPIEVDVSGGKQVSLVVDFADFGDEQDHADWLNARLLP